MKKNKVLITAGNTRIPIDRVRGIDNIFRGRTGAAIAKYFAEKGCEVTLLTSHPKLVVPEPNLTIVKYNTYDSLVSTMKTEIRTGAYDVVIHSSAVSDYSVEGTYKRTGSIETNGRLKLELVKLDSSGKIGSDHKELWMKLIPTMKIVDQIRKPWGFRGKLVKFKLQVDMDDEELLRVATRSMEHSKADFIVANTLEGMNKRAYIVSHGGMHVVSVSREDLPATLFEEVSI